jgi:hypothetical protein
MGRNGDGDVGEAESSESRRERTNRRPSGSKHGIL